MKQCDNKIVANTTECSNTEKAVPFRKWFKMLKKAIKIAKTKEELNKLYDKAIENQKYFSAGQGRLFEELYFNKMKTM
jgi:hypothetical protein